MAILVTVAMTSKAWVIIAGGVLGILMMRLVVLWILAASATATAGAPERAL